MVDSHYENEFSNAYTMPPLLEKIRGKVFTREKSLRIVVLGSQGVGKTALIIRCLTNQFFNNYVPGKETAYKYTVPFAGKKINFDICDSNGKNDAMISYTDAVMLVFSVTDRLSFKNVEGLIEKVRQLNVNNIPIVVVANKIDQIKKRVVSKKELEKLSIKQAVPVLERSAAIPTHDVSSVFIELYKLVEINRKARRDSDPSLNDPSTKMNLRAIRRLSTSLDSNDFIKLVL